MQHRVVRMTAALAVAAVLAALSATCLGLVDAGQELDAELARLESEAAALHRTTSAAVERGTSIDPNARPRTAVRQTVDSLGAIADRIVRDTAPPYARAASRLLSVSIELVPPADTIDRALGAYLDQIEQAQAETARTPAAAELRGRLLNLSYEVLAQRIAEARARTREGVGRALAGVQLITLVSIGIAALAVGFAGQTPPANSPAATQRRRPIV